MAEESTGGAAGALVVRKQGRRASGELRGRAVAAVLEGGMSVAAAARHFDVDHGSVRRWVGRFLERGHVRPDKPPGRPSLIERQRGRIFRILEARPAISGAALREALAAEGVEFAASTVQGFLRRHGLERARRLARLRARRKRWTGQ